MKRLLRGSQETHPGDGALVLDVREYPPLREAQARRAALEARIVTLQAAEVRARERATACGTELPRLRAEHRRGQCSDATLAQASKDWTAAQQAAEDAAYELREATIQRDELTASIVVLEQEALRVTAQNLLDETRRAALALDQVFSQAAPLNERLVQLFDLAEAQFTSRDPARRTAGVPICAGIENLAWPALRHHPYAQDGGPLGHWRKRLARLLAQDAD
jgi:hypothetical protein